MTLCPNTPGKQCVCQPQDGDMCPNGPQPPFKPWVSEMTDESIAASELSDEQIDQFILDSVPFVTSPYGESYWDAGGLIRKVEMRQLARACIAADRALRASSGATNQLLWEILDNDCDDLQSVKAIARTLRASSGEGNVAASSGGRVDDQSTRLDDGGAR